MQGQWQWPVLERGQPVWHLLLHLVAAVGAGEADNHLQLLGGVVHKLLLEGSLLGPRGPGQPLIQVQQPIHAQGDGDQLPAYGFPNLKNKIFISLNKLSYRIKANSAHFLKTISTAFSLDLFKKINVFHIITAEQYSYIHMSWSPMTQRMCRLQKPCCSFQPKEVPSDHHLIQALNTDLWHREYAQLSSEWLAWFLTTSWLWVSRALQVLIWPTLCYTPGRTEQLRLCHPFQQGMLPVLLATPPTTMTLMEVRDVSEAKLNTKGTIKSSWGVLSGVMAGRLAADGVLAKGRGI